jgi:hemerythrin
MSTEKLRHYLTGIQSVDDEHVALFGCLSDYKKFAKVNDLNGAESAKTQFFKLLHAHTAHEEILMDEVEYPYRAYHKQLHKQLVYKFEMTPYAFPVAYSALQAENEFLRHIDVIDIQFATYYKQYQSLQEDSNV